MIGESPTTNYNGVVLSTLLMRSSILSSPLIRVVVEPFLLLVGAVMGLLPERAFRSGRQAGGALIYQLREQKTGFAPLFLNEERKKGRSLDRSQ